MDVVYKKIEELEIPSPYKDALKDFLGKLKPFLPLIECIALVGSIARREDFVNGWSDIDVLIVTKTPNIIRNIKEIAEQVNTKYPRTKKNSGILSLWIDDAENVAKWFGIGCEYYNVKNAFILLYGKDIRSRLREPSRSEILRLAKHMVEEAEKYLAVIKEKHVLHKIDTLSIASIVYPLMRFYLCLKGYPVASRKKMIEIIREKNLDLDPNEKKALITVLEDLLKGKQRVDPQLNDEISKLVEKILRYMRKEAIS